MRTPTAVAAVLLSSLLYACGDTTATTLTPSPAPSTAVPVATTTEPPGTEPRATTSSTTVPAPVGENGITQEEDQLIPPIAPDTPTIETSSAGLVIRWRGIGPSDLMAYLVYYRQSPDDTWTQLAEVLPEGDNRGEYAYNVPEGLDQGAGYAVVSLDVDGNRSQFAIAES